jgi:hypothetical protein
MHNSTIDKRSIDTQAQMVMERTYRDTAWRIGCRHGRRIRTNTDGVVVVVAVVRMWIAVAQQLCFVCCCVMPTCVQRLCWRCHFERFETGMKPMENRNRFETELLRELTTNCDYLRLFSFAGTVEI